MNNILLSNILSILKRNTDSKFSLVFDNRNTGISYKISIKDDEIILLVSKDKEEIYQCILDDNSIYNLNLEDFKFKKFIETTSVEGTNKFQKRFEYLNCYIEELYIIICRQLRERAHMFIKTDEYGIIEAHYIDGKVVFILEDGVLVKFQVASFYQLRQALGDYELITISDGFDRKNFSELKSFYRTYAKLNGKTFIS